MTQQTEVKEIWKDWKKNSNYMISNTGRVFRKEVKLCNKLGVEYPKKAQIIQPIKSNGYHRLVMKCSQLNNGDKKYYSIHRMVAEEFLENPNNLPCVNHKNGIRNDNRVENLEWCTYSENTQHAVKTGLMKFREGEKHHNSVLSDSQIKEILQRHIHGKESQFKLAKEYGISNRTISAWLKGDNRAYLSKIV